MLLTQRPFLLGDAPPAVPPIARPTWRGAEGSQEAGVAERFHEVQRLVDERPTLSQRDKLELALLDNRLKRLLQQQEDLRFQKAKNQKQLSKLEEMNDELLRELDLLRFRRIHRDHSYLAASAERSIQEDLYNVQIRKRVIQQKQDFLHQDEARVTVELQDLDRELVSFKLSLQPRPESAPRFRSDYQAGSFRPPRLPRPSPIPPVPSPSLYAAGRLDSPVRHAPRREASRSPHFDVPNQLSNQFAQPTAAWKATSSLDDGEIAVAKLDPLRSPVAPQPATQVEPEEQNDPIKEILEEHGLQEMYVLGDGNCQFRALADQLAPYYSQDCHDQVRARVVQQLRAMPERYLPFVSEDYDEWVDRMAADKEWGNEVTLRAAADAFGAEIHVFADNLGEGQLYSAYEPSEKKMSKVLRLVFRSIRGDSGHYNAVEPLRSK